MVNGNKIDNLEAKVFEAIKQIAYLTKKSRALNYENKKLKARLAEQELFMEGLQKTIEELKKNSRGAELFKYQENEGKIKERIQKLLAKLDELKLVD